MMVNKQAIDSADLTGQVFQYNLSWRVLLDQGPDILYLPGPIIFFPHVSGRLVYCWFRPH